MVVKKYLCSVPKVESWEEKAKALLKSLNGDEKKLEQVAHQTLSILKEQRYAKETSSFIYLKYNIIL